MLSSLLSINFCGSFLNQSQGSRGQDGQNAESRSHESHPRHHRHASFELTMARVTIH